MRKQQKKTNKLLNGLKEHIYNNIKLYIIVSIFFLIGIIAGVILANNTQIDIQESINNNISTFINCLKTDYQIDYTNLLKNLIGTYILFVFLLWFMGCTVIGIPIVYGLIVWKGFSLSYTLASVILSLGIGKGIIFSTLSLLLQNIIIIPATLALAVSGIKLYKSIMKDKRKENIKIEIARHTIFSLLMLVLFILSALIEVYISSNLISLTINYM